MNHNPTPQGTELKRFDYGKPVETQANLVQVLNRQKDQFAAALCKRLDTDYFIRVALTAARKNPLLMRCTTESLLMSLMDLAALKLTPNSVTGEAYLIPFQNNGVYESTLIIGYKGYVKLMRQANEIANLHADIVTKHDEFVCEYGSNRRLVHVPSMKHERNDESEWLGAYAYLRYANGGEEFIWVPSGKVNRIRASSRSKNKGPWVDWTDAMWAKTALLQLKKTVALTSEAEEAVQRAMEIDSDNAIDVQASVAPAPEPSGLTERPSEQRQRTRRRTATQVQEGQGPVQPPSPPSRPSQTAMETQGQAGAGENEPPIGDPDDPNDLFRDQ